MALRVKAVTAQLARLSATGLRPTTRTAVCAFAINNRPASRFLTTETNSTTTPASSSAADLPTSMAPGSKPESEGKTVPYLTGDLAAAEWPLGHGDRIWFFRHILDGLTIFSLQRVFKANKQLRTLPFNGKKVKPSKFRKDYWEPFAMVEFPKDHRLVGLSVYHMLREAHFLHTYMWSPSKQPSLVKDQKTNATYDKHERGEALNKHMLPNVIADMAAVLGGLGKGNKIWVEKAAPGEQGSGPRVPVTVYWSDTKLKDHATAWPDNVSHVDAAAAEQSVLAALPSNPVLEKGHTKKLIKGVKSYPGKGEPPNSELQAKPGNGPKPWEEASASSPRWGRQPWETRGRVAPKIAKKRRDYY